MQMSTHQTSPLPTPGASAGYAAPLLTQPVAWNPGMLAGAYAQAQEVAAGMVRDAQDGATTLDQRVVALLQVPQRFSSAAADPDSKAHAGKRKRDEPVHDDAPACVKPGVWKAAKAADAARRGAYDGHCYILDNALESGSKGPKAVKAFLRAYADTPETHLQPEADFMLGDRVFLFLCSLEGTPPTLSYSQRLAWALDLVRQLPAAHRPGKTWAVGAIAVALLPLARRLNTPGRQLLAEALARLACEVPDREKEGQIEREHVRCMEPAGILHFASERGIRRCVSKMMLGELSHVDGARVLNALFSQKPERSELR